jgi:hypothetical protein
LLKFDLYYHIDSLEFVFAFEDATIELMGISARDLDLLSIEHEDIERLKVIIMRSQHLDFEAGNKLPLHEIIKFQQA